VEDTKPGDKLRKPLPSIPANNVDSESDESMWVLQQVDGDSKKALASNGSKRCNIPCSWARKEGWSGV
jgi:hypothetical protein